jgi:hypothetical protein
MYPVNQVILGNADPMASTFDNIDTQMQLYQAKLNQLKAMQQTQSVKLIWDDVDAEVKPMTKEQRERLFQDSDYLDNYNEIQDMVQAEILNIVKPRIENTERGKELLSNQLKIVKRLKNKIINDTNKEMELFVKFKDYTKQHPNATYEEFLKLMYNGNY